MSKILKNASLWSAILMLSYLVIKNWIGVDIPAWDDIYTQIVAILSIICGV